MAADDARDEVLDAFDLPEALLVTILGTADGDMLSGCELPADEIARLIVEHAVPLVLAYGDRIAREAAGKALRDAADQIIAGLGAGGFNPASPYAGAFRDGLRARAEAADGGGQA